MRNRVEHEFNIGWVRIQLYVLETWLEINEIYEKYLDKGSWAISRVSVLKKEFVPPASEFLVALFLTIDQDFISR